MTDFVTEFARDLPEGVLAAALTTLKEIFDFRVSVRPRDLHFLALACIYYASRFQGHYKSIEIIAADVTENADQQQIFSKGVRKMVRKLEKLCTCGTLRLSYRTRRKLTPLSVDLVTDSCVKLGWPKYLVSEVHGVCIETDQRLPSLSPISVAAGAIYQVTQFRSLPTTPADIASVLCTTSQNVKASYRKLRVEKFPLG